MRVAHLAVVTPGRCGLYETTRELVAGLRDLGVDSRIVDPTHEKNTLHPGGSADRGAALSTMAWALEADVIVSHSGIGPELEATDQPLIHVAHGRPRSSFLLELDGTKVYAHMYTKNREPRCKAVVTFWPEHEQFLRVIFSAKPVHTVTAPVDLERWAPGPSGYNFGGKAGRVNVVCADMWRRDADPFFAINAFALWARDVPGAKLHLFGVRDAKKLSPLLATLASQGSLGQVAGHVRGLEHVYRAADLAIVGQDIATRSVREAMACGCPVVRVPSVVLNGFVGDFETARSASRDSVRAAAETEFDPARTAAQFYDVLEGLAR